MRHSALILAATLLLAACASGQGGSAPHPHGYGHRDSPGRAWPVDLPVPGYDYRFRPDPQGLGRDMPAWESYAAAPEPIVAWPHGPPPPHGAPAYVQVERSAYVAGGETYSVREEYSEDLYLEGGYIVEPAPYPADGPRPYLDADAFY